jgi:hypothetical protein
MGKVKPARVVTPRIVQPGGKGRTWLWLVFLLALAAWSWQVFEFGRQRGGYYSAQHGRTEAGLRARIAELEDERDALRSASARFERAGQIDRAAADGVQSEVRTLQEERAELRREVAFLKSLVSPGGEKLILGGYSLTAMSGRAYRFEVTLSKPSADADTVIGQVTISVRGRTGGRTQTLDMAALTKGKRTNFGIQFKNFQKLQAELQLPDGFEPASIEVAVKPDGKTFKAFERAFDWKVSDA